ncbi:MAG: hypothetical protein R3E31_11310 [Chloroflexota bacterium]
MPQNHDRFDLIAAEGYGYALCQISHSSPVSHSCNAVFITAVLFAIVVAAPPEERAALYFPAAPAAFSPPQIETMTNRIIAEHGLDKPFPVQYANWVGDMLRGDWGWSPTFNTDVLELLLLRTPVTARLTFIL